MILRSILSIKKFLKSNIKVAENYFFMTAIQLISALIGLIVYPYVIRSIGADSYGTYVYANSISSYFIGLISFGFSFPVIKAIAQNPSDGLVKQSMFAKVLSAKFYLFIISIIAFLILLFTIPVMMDNKALFIWCFIQVIGELIFPIWYFQAIQKMKFVSLVQIFFRVLSLPFIFIFVNSPNDNVLYAAIVSLISVAGGAVGLFILMKIEGLYFRFVSISKIRDLVKDALPFFLSSFTSDVKDSSVTVIIGSFFSMRDVALFDLAQKIVVLPRMFTVNFNQALFPKMIKDFNAKLVKRVLFFETLIGLAVSTLIFLFGYWVVLFLGGDSMVMAYPLSVVLSFTILVWLVVGSYISFVFVPQNYYGFTVRNQILALASFVFYAFIGLFLYHHLMVIVLALTLSGITEIIYCMYLTRKHKLL